MGLGFLVKSYLNAQTFIFRKKKKSNKPSHCSFKKNYYICLISRCLTYELPAITISKDSGVPAITLMREWCKDLFAQAAVCSGACLPPTPHSITPSEGYLATYFDKTVLPRECKSSEKQLIPTCCACRFICHRTSP